MKSLVLTLVIVLSVPFVSEAQVLTTGETLGAGKSAAFVSENHLYVDGIDLNIAYVQYVRGLSGRFDLYLSFGETHIFGEGQFWVSVGGNARLARWRGTSVSALALASVPVHRHGEASTTLLTTALVMSRSLNSRVAVYSGVNSLIPVGARSRGFFTPPTYKVNVPAGTLLTFGSWGVFAEIDIGRLKAIGIGVARAF